MASINEIHNLMTTARAEHPVASSAIAEFIQAYKQAREDSDDGIRESASLISPWRCWSARYNQDCGNCLRLSSGSAFTAC